MEKIKEMSAARPGLVQLQCGQLLHTGGARMWEGTGDGGSHLIACQHEAHPLPPLPPPCDTYVLEGRGKTFRK